MSSENVKPDQIQASVAAALSRLRGDLGPSAAAAPKIEEPARDIGRPANDVRGDPFFRSIQSPPAPSAAMAPASREPIPITPFSRMQAPQEPAPTEPESSEEPDPTPEPTAAIEIPEMPERTTTPDLISMPEISMPEPGTPSSPSPQPASAPLAAAVAAPAAAAGSASPLARMMRTPGAPEAPSAPAQRDLLAGLPPPPISEPLTADTDSSAMRRRRRNRRLLAAALVIIVVAIGAWLWSGGQQTAEVPVIAAETTPEKVKPADEGGLQVPNQNVQVLENMDGAPAQSQAETVMPEPEQPVTPPAATGEQAPTVVENNAAETAAPTTAEAPAVDTPPAPEVPLATAPLPEQEQNATTTEVTPPSPQVEPAAPAPEPTQTAEAPAASAPSEQAPAEQAPAEVAAQPASEPAQPEPAPAVQPEPTATQEAAVTPTAPAGNTRVQLAAGKSEDSVRQEWAAMQKAYPDLLGGLTLTIQRVDKGAAGIFYRLQAGPLADKDAAKKLCASLKQKHQDCIVVTK